MVGQQKAGEIYEQRIRNLQRRMGEEKIDVFIIDDADSIYFLTGFWGYLGMEYGRATILIIPRDDVATLVTPQLEYEMATALARVPNIRAWGDGVGREWLDEVGGPCKPYQRATIAIEIRKTHPTVSAGLRTLIKNARFVDGASILSRMRMIKSPEEIATMRKAGEIGVAMMTASRDAIAEGVPQYEVSLAAMQAGTRKAAEFLSADEPHSWFSPLIHNLPVMQSGKDLSMVHRRPCVKRLQHGDPIYFCYCGIVTFKQMKLGFDRQFFLGKVTDQQARYYEIAKKAQQTALAAIKPRVLAEDVHKAAEEVYAQEGLSAGYRTGRGIGYSFLEAPELKHGDKTRLEAGMTFAVDGGVTLPSEGGSRVGDSIVVTESGFDYLTEFPRELTIL